MITAKVICDSISKQGKRITTLEIEYPRFIHCFDDKTEVLSQIGDESPEFRSFKSVFKLGCKVAQFNEETDVINFVYPDNTIENRGVHKLVSFESNKLSLCVTDEHRMFTRKRTTNNEYKNSTVLAKELLGDYGCRRIPKAGYMFQKQILTSNEIQLIAWFVADGHSEGNTSSFHFKKERKINKVEFLLGECGIEYKKLCYGDDTIIRFLSPSWVNKCYTKDGEKIIPDFATMMNQETYNDFKLALLESDGCLANNEYNTSSKTLAHQIQVIALLHGDAMNIRCYDSGMYKQKFLSSNYISIRQDKDKFKEEIKDTTVYCVTVQSSYLVVRRNGVAFISGNCELMTHRMLSKNCASSRAIPVNKVIEQVKNNPAMPIHWGKNKSGMQADEECDMKILHLPNQGFPPIMTREEYWKHIANDVSVSAGYFDRAGYHKQIVNRLLEPFQMMKTVITATEWENFFWLRLDKDAQPEIQELARVMKEAMDNSAPQLLDVGMWHLPYVTSIVEPPCEQCYDDQIYFSEDNEQLTLEEAKAISASCCAQVSYRATNHSKEKALDIYQKLISGSKVHASPFEHQAKPMRDKPLFDGYNDNYEINFDVGETSYHKDLGFMSGNFAGWIQHRQLIGGNTKWK